MDHVPVGTSYTEGGIAYYKWRDALTGPVQLFVHGLGSSAAAWTPVIEPLLLEHTSGTILALDLPGFGQSRVRRGHIIDQAVEAIGEVASTLDPARPLHIIAHSVGGIIAAEASFQSEQVSRLTLIRNCPRTLAGQDYVALG